jgi:DNA primase
MADNRRVDFVDLRKRADFRAVLNHYGITPRGKGDQVKIPCPFHDDVEPSCSVNHVKRVYNCFGCHAGGNVLEFVHEMENRNGQGVTLRQAGILLAEVSGIELPPGNGAQRPKEARTASRQVETAKHRRRPLKRVLGARSARRRARARARKSSATSHSASSSHSTHTIRT